MGFLIGLVELIQNGFVVAGVEVVCFDMVFQPLGPADRIGRF